MYLKLFGSIVLAFVLMTACQDSENKNDDATTDQNPETQSQVPENAFDSPADNPADITDAEFNQFIAVMNEAQLINMQTQSEMLESLEDIGLDTAKYNKIFQSKQNPDMPSDATEEELKKYEEALKSFEGIQKANQAKIEKILEDNNLSMERVREIETAIQSDPKLQQRFQQLMQEGAQE